MPRIDWPHTLSETPATLWAYAAFSVGEATTAAVLESPLPGLLGVLAIVVFTYFVLRGLRIFWQIAIVLQVGGLAFAPAQDNAVLHALLLAAGLTSLLLPQSRHYFAKTSVSPGVGA